MRPRIKPARLRLLLALSALLSLGLTWLGSAGCRQNLFAGAAEQRWNVVFIIMESTGAEYPFSTSAGNDLPMPFLQKLAARSLVGENHFSPTNTTPSGTFSITSGLFPAPTMEIYAERRDIHLPHFRVYLQPEYKHLYVLNGAQTWFFPQHYYRHNGIPVFGKEDLPKGNWRPAPKLGVNEPKLVDFFLEKTAALPEPFTAVYHSFVAHFPYYDYGKDYDLFKGRKPKISHFEVSYLNNLRLMDTLIEKIYRNLERSGRLERTILVLTGDHGEAFGRPRGVWVHSKHSFNVNFRVPLVIHQPKLFAPARVTRLTQHPDIVPTLLQAMGIPVPPGRLQGESILAPQARRRFAFLWGNEGTLSSIGTDRIKVQKREGSCWAYDLNADPNETRRISCRRHAEQARILSEYGRYQPRALREYNAAVRKGQPFRLAMPNWWETEAVAEADSGKSAVVRGE